ncbi:MAG: 30S ribosomal protein S4 [Thermoplasmatales archaeon]|nr:MAG: 30S ribosomal protein S4 [Thermoplasmatales archaeon]
MGKPKFSRKKYETPSHPWQEDRIKNENELIKKYGLKNKREIWKAQTKLRKYRGQARELLAKVETGDIQSKKESDQLLMHLNRFNILPVKASLDDVLALETESILTRRLQTLTYLKGLASTPTQSRQLISHGHIAIGERRVTVPSYMVTKEEEGEINYTSDSPLNDTMHPARPRADFKSIPIKKEVGPKQPEIKPEVLSTKEPLESTIQEPPKQKKGVPEKKDEVKPETPKEEEKLKEETSQFKLKQKVEEPKEKKESPTEEKTEEQKKDEKTDNEEKSKDNKKGDE